MEPILTSILVGAATKLVVGAATGVIEMIRGSSGEDVSGSGKAASAEFDKVLQAQPAAPPAVTAIPRGRGPGRAPTRPSPVSGPLGPPPMQFSPSRGRRLQAIAAYQRLAPAIR